MREKRNGNNLRSQKAGFYLLFIYAHVPLKVLKMGIFVFLGIYKGIQSMYKVVRIAVLTAVLFHIDKIAEI
jgi:hypothetical protein